jgi:transcriptional regulator with XRE-family HTH domain
MDTKNLTLGEQIRTLRRRAGLSQTKLARIVGVHLSSISRWERDLSTAEMSLKHFMRIAQATGTPVSDLLAVSGFHEDDANARGASHG